MINFNKYRLTQILFLSISIFLSGNAYTKVISGASFLKISPGARPVGMGGAYTAIASDINALYYNPAGIGNINQPQMGAMHTEWLSNIRYDFAGGIIPLGKGSIGISVIYLTTGKIDGRDETGKKTDDFYSSDFALVFSRARQINSNIQIGGNVKLIREKIADEKAEGIAFDIGGKWKEEGGNFGFGLSIRNLGPRMKFIEEKYSLPLSITAGISYNLISPFNLAMDISYEPIDKKRTICFGTEFWPMEFFALRAGYLFQVFETLYNSRNNLSNNKISEQHNFGGGIGLNIFGYNLDYAMVPYSELGITQRISFSMGF